MNNINFKSAKNGRNKKFNSKFTCVDTAVSNFGARAYDPSIGRWTTKDPIGFDGGDTNLYAYVGGNPMSYVDPSGLDREIIRTPGIIPHDYLRVFDPTMPGNDTYIGFGPAGGKTNVFLNLFRDVPGMVDISDERPNGKIVPGSYRNTSRQENEDILSRANIAARKAIYGELMYSVKEFNYNNNSKRTNCRGFAEGL